MLDLITSLNSLNQILIKIRKENKQLLSEIALNENKYYLQLQEKKQQMQKIRSYI